MDRRLIKPRSQCTEEELWARVTVKSRMLRDRLQPLKQRHGDYIVAYDLLADILELKMRGHQMPLGD